MAAGLMVTVPTLDHHRTFLVLDSLGLLSAVHQAAVGITVGQQLPVMVEVEVLVEALPTVRPAAKVLQTLAVRVHHLETSPGVRWVAMARAFLEYLVSLRLTTRAVAVAVTV